MKVDIKKMPQLRVATVRHVGPYNQIPQAFERLGQLAARAGLVGLRDADMIAVYYDDPDSVPQNQLRSDAGIVVPPDVTLPRELTEQQLPAGRYASTTHIGPYEQLGDTWARFKGEGLTASGHRIGDGVSYEIYRNDPRTTPKEELRTELFIPIAG